MDFPVLHIQHSPIKHLNDLAHSKYLEENSYTFNDGNDEVVDFFAIKVGVNGNNFGVGVDNFDENVDKFKGLPVIADPLGITHENGKRTLKFITENQGGLEVGTITEVKKYDTDGDGKNDFARVLGHISKDETKKQRYKMALAAGINETSPTIQPLDFTQDIHNITKWYPVNLTMTKDGAYYDSAKIKAVCRGAVKTCSNALAAALNLQNDEKSNTTLINVLTKSGYMSGNEGSNTQSSGNAGNPNSGNGVNPGQPLVNVYTGSGQAASFDPRGSPSTSQGNTNKAEGNEPKPDNNKDSGEQPKEDEE
jgi:hypothetical protein